MISVWTPGSPSTKLTSSTEPISASKPPRNAAHLATRTSPSAPRSPPDAPTWTASAPNNSAVPSHTTWETTQSLPRPRRQTSTDPPRRRASPANSRSATPTPQTPSSRPWPTPPAPAPEESATRSRRTEDSRRTGGRTSKTRERSTGSSLPRPRCVAAARCRRSSTAPPERTKENGPESRAGCRRVSNFREQTPVKSLSTHPRHLWRLSCLPQT